MVEELRVMARSNLAKLNTSLSDAQDYAAWSATAQLHDIETGVIDWKETDESKHFDYQSIRRRLRRLKRLRKNKDNRGLLYALNEGVHGNMDGMGNGRLYEKAKFGSKRLIEDYVDAIDESLTHLASKRVKDIEFEEKLDFFRRAQHCYGGSAFLMSGSGAYLYFHLGVAKALWREGLLPRVISGSSGGSAVAAIICTHTDEDIDTLFDPDMLVGKDVGITSARRAQRMSQDQVRNRIAQLIPDLTFQEAYELTGRHLNISIAPAQRHQMSRLLNAIASPNVFIRDAVLASCALPGVYPPVKLAAEDHEGKRVPYLPDRKWVDGSVTNDLPAKRLARLYGSNHFVISLANPLVLPFAADVKQKRGPIAAIMDATTKTSIAWLNAYASVIQKPMSYFPRVNSAANMALSVINQNYTGDVNIIRPQLNWSFSKMLSDLSRDDIEYLMDLGERATWPKIEQVRTQTKVGKTLESILRTYEDQLVDGYEIASAMKKKIA